VGEDQTTLNYRETPGVATYLRLELERTQDGETYRTDTSPLGFESRRSGRGVRPAGAGGWVSPKLRGFGGVRGWWIEWPALRRVY
jgi:hypothetical protein